MRRCKKKLRNRIIEDCLKVGEFTLSSGGTSNYFIDLSKLYMRGDGAYLIGKTIYHHTKNMDFDAIGGPVMGAVPLTSPTVVRYWKREHRIMDGFYVRWTRNADQVRSYQSIEGQITRRHKAIVLEDVCTTGASAALAVKAVQELVGCKVVEVVALVDREEGAKERFQEMGIEFDSIFRAKKLVEIATNSSKANLVGAVKGSLRMARRLEVQNGQKTKETVNHPLHYGGKDNPYEVIKVIEAWELGFHLGNMVKYIARAGKKADLLEDLKKAQWYLTRHIENLEKKKDGKENPSR